MSKYYRLLLDDYSAPSFTSFDKDYYGTLEQMHGFFSALKADEEAAQRQEYLLSIYDQYVAGQKAIKHRVAYQKVPFLVPANILGEEKLTRINYTWDHLNTWQFPYHMKCDRIDSRHLWISCHGKYTRCIQAKFTNLFYNGFGKNYKRFSGNTWGFPHQVEYEGIITFSRLFVEEKAFKTKAEALNDQMNFRHNPDPIYSGILNDIFGDG
jgi:hypothetical protein